ncbi:MAG: glycosyltransferase [Planctomycetaceae bacterium]|jgi:glycosyltransferase involved in cell wall biosynthesis|nr:glycosyltransferase [Planctomycetaceae bacterium]
MTAQPLHILHVIGDLEAAKGGPPVVALCLAAAQAEALGRPGGIAGRTGRVTLAAVDTGLPRLDPHTVLSGPPPEALTIRLLPGPTGRLSRFTGSHAAADLTALIAQADVLVIHGVWIPILPVAGRIARRLGKPFVLFPHGVLDPWAVAAKSLKKRLALLAGYGGLIRSAAAVQALSPYEQRCLTDGGWHTRVRVIPNGVFPRQIDPLPEPGAFRHTLPALADHPFILFLARLHPGKGLHLLADAAARLHPAHPDLHFVIAGPDEGAAADLNAQIARLNLTHRFHLTGPIYDRRKFAALADAFAFALPSEHEGFSMSIVEAMACARPVVISPECNFPAVAQADAGVITPRDPAAIAAAIDTLLRNPQQASEMGRRARQLVLERYTWPAIAEQSVGWLAGLADHPPASGPREAQPHTGR